jgi:hypothetical protein
VSLGHILGLCRSATASTARRVRGPGDGVDVRVAATDFTFVVGCRLGNLGVRVIGLVRTWSWERCVLQRFGGHNGGYQSGCHLVECCLLLFGKKSEESSPHVKHDLGAMCCAVYRFSTSFLG